MIYERKIHPLASKEVYYRRIIKNLIFMIAILMVCLCIGILGYHYTANIGWLDSLHNASMILSGMGPVVEINTVAGKWFSSGYALFSGVAFISSIGVLIAPIAHRFFHKLHLDNE